MCNKNTDKVCFNIMSPLLVSFYNSLEWGRIFGKLFGLNINFLLFPILFELSLSLFLPLLPYAPSDIPLSTQCSSTVSVSWFMFILCCLSSASFFVKKTSCSVSVPFFFVFFFPIFYFHKTLAEPARRHILTHISPLISSNPIFLPLLFMDSSLSKTWIRRPATSLLSTLNLCSDW